MAYYDHGAAIEAQKCAEEFEKLFSWMKEFAAYQRELTKKPSDEFPKRLILREEIRETIDAEHQPKEDPEKEVELWQKLNAIDVTKALRHKEKQDLQQKEKNERLGQFENCFKAFSALLPPPLDMGIHTVIGS